MSNYFNHVSFIIPCSVAQAEMAVQAVDFIDSHRMAAGYGVFQKELSACTELEVLIRCVAERHPAFNSENPGIMSHLDGETNLPFCVAFSVTEKGLWVFSNESIDITHAIALTQGILAAFNMPIMVEIPVAYTCSEPVTEGFGGGAFMVTKDAVSDNSVGDFIQAERDAFIAQEAYYLVNVTRYKGEQTTDHPYLMNVHNTNVGADLFNMLLLSVASKEGAEDAFISETGYIGIDDQSGIGAGAIRPLTPLEYSVMKAYLPNVSNLITA